MSTAQPTTPARPSGPERRLLKRTAIALLVFVSLCISAYLCCIPGPLERRLAGCWTTTISNRWPDDEHHVFMQLKLDGHWTTWWRRGDRPWEVGGTGRWSFDGTAINLHPADDERSLRDLLETRFAGHRHDQLTVLEVTPDHLLTRAEHHIEKFEWTWTRASDERAPEN